MSYLLFLGDDLLYLADDLPLPADDLNPLMSAYGIPGTVFDGVYRTPLVVYLGRFCYLATKRMPIVPRKYRTIRLLKALGEMLPTPTFVATALLQQLLCRYRAWKIGSMGCGIHSRIRCTEHTAQTCAPNPCRADATISTGKRCLDRTIGGRSMFARNV